VRGSQSLKVESVDRGRYKGVWSVLLAGRGEKRWRGDCRGENLGSVLRNEFEEDGGKK